MKSLLQQFHKETDSDTGGTWDQAIVTKHSDDGSNPIRHWQRQYHTTAVCLEVLCCKACSWPAAKLGIWGQPTTKQTEMPSIYPSGKRGKHVQLS